MKKTRSGLPAMGGAARCLMSDVYWVCRGHNGRTASSGRYTNTGWLSSIPVIECNSVGVPLVSGTFEERLRVDSVVSLTVILSVGCTSDVCVGFLASRT